MAGKTKIKQPKMIPARIIYKEIIYSEKPNCPGCNERNYKIIDSGMKNGQQKFTARCNNCNAEFSYVKSIKRGDVDDENNSGT